MKIINTPIKGVYIVENLPIVDHRGSFTRQFCINELESLLSGKRIEQINHSHTKVKGTVRGMHLQLGDKAETKFVRCTAGSVFDVAVDLRANSPTFLKHFAIELCETKPLMLVIPEGVGHGFQSLSDNSCIQYLVTNSYAPEQEVGVRYNDPKLNIQWPLSILDISEKDSTHPHLLDDFSGFTF